MGSNWEKQGIFPRNLITYVSMLFKIKGTIRGKAITISIAPNECNNYIRDKFSVSNDKHMWKVRLFE